jgi:hypothetical protein
MNVGISIMNVSVGIIHNECGYGYDDIEYSIDGWWWVVRVYVICM